MKHKVLITAGPTREWMDPVRYLSNPSSGAMGIFLAEAFARRGNKVTLVLGPTHLKVSPKVKVVPVVTALEMYAAVKKSLHSTDAFIATAAVGDWRFSKTSSVKSKKGSSKTMTVQLIKNPDILAEAVAPIKVGFSLETNNLKKNALEKMKRKKLDLIIANGPVSFASEHIQPIWVEKTGVTKMPKMKKSVLAEKIVRWLERKWNETV